MLLMSHIIILQAVTLYVNNITSNNIICNDMAFNNIDVGVKRYFAPNDTGLLRALHSRNPQKHS